MNSKDVLERAYGNMPKEATPYMDLDWVPTRRGVRYYWLILLRKFRR
jgi:hypothetical protein